MCHIFLTSRRGLVDVNDIGEKPVFSPDELYRNRRLGLSVKAISKKLGIDKSKEEALVLERRVSEAAFQMTPSYQEGNGRCRCGGVKSLKFKWKQSPIDLPSFFGGCVKYTHNDRHLHDSAKSCPGTTWKIMEKHRMSMMPSDIRLLYDRCSCLLTEWLAKEPNSTTASRYDLVAKIFGGKKQHLPLQNKTYQFKYWCLINLRWYTTQGRTLLYFMIVNKYFPRKVRLNQWLSDDQGLHVIELVSQVRERC